MKPQENSFVQQQQVLTLTNQPTDSGFPRTNSQIDLDLDDVNNDNHLQRAHEPDQERDVEQWKGMPRQLKFDNIEDIDDMYSAAEIEDHHANTSSMQVFLQAQSTSAGTKHPSQSCMLNNDASRVKMQESLYADCYNDEVSTDRADRPQFRVATNLSRMREQPADVKPLRSERIKQKEIVKQRNSAQVIQQQIEQIDHHDATSTLLHNMNNNLKRSSHFQEESAYTQNQSYADRPFKMIKVLDQNMFNQTRGCYDSSSTSLKPVAGPGEFNLHESQRSFTIQPLKLDTKTLNSSAEAQFETQNEQNGSYQKLMPSEGHQNPIQSDKENHLDNHQLHHHQQRNLSNFDPQTNHLGRPQDSYSYNSPQKVQTPNNKSPLARYFSPRIVQQSPNSKNPNSSSPLKCPASVTGAPNFATSLEDGQKHQMFTSPSKPAYTSFLPGAGSAVVGHFQNKNNTQHSTAINSNQMPPCGFETPKKFTISALRPPTTASVTSKFNKLFSETKIQGQHQKASFLSNTQQKQKKSNNRSTSQTASYIPEYQSPKSPPIAVGNEHQGDADSSNKALGLKVISRQVMDAVRQTGTTTYKQVANLVSKNNDFFHHHQHHLNQNQHNCDQGCSSSQGTIMGHKTAAQQEKNLRRRVYDSLNVLYAVGMLKKGPDRSVYLSGMASIDNQSSSSSNNSILIEDNGSPTQQIHLNSEDNVSPIKEHQSLSESKKRQQEPAQSLSVDYHLGAEIAKTESLTTASVDRLCQKRSHMLQLMRNLLSCKRIIKRNAKAAEKDAKLLTKQQHANNDQNHAHNQRQGGNHANQVNEPAAVGSILENVHIMMPFLLVSIPESNNQLYLNEFQPTRLELISQQQMHLFAEADVLSLMGLDLEAVNTEGELTERLGSEFSEVGELLQQLQNKIEL